MIIDDSNRDEGMVNMLMFVIGGAFAGVYDIQSFECCKVVAGERPEVRRTILVIPPTDHREVVVAEPQRFATLVGIVRGGYGNPFNLQSPTSVQALTAEAIADQLRALGHDVRVASDHAKAPGSSPPSHADLALLGRAAEVDLVVTGRIDRWEVDLSNSSFRIDTGIHVTVLDVASGTEVWSVDLQSERTRKRDLAELSEKGVAWYGKPSGATRLQYRNTLGVEVALLEMVRPLADSTSYFTAKRASPAPVEQ